MATFGDGETIEDYALHLNQMALTLATLGDPVEDVKIVDKIIRSISQCFEQIVLVITTLLDLSTLTVADLVGRLKAVEETFEEAIGSQHHDGKLYLTEEEWDARRKKREAENHSSGGKNGGSGRREGGQRGRGRGRGDQSSKESSSGKHPSDKCRNCGKKGHWACECPEKTKKGKVHAVKEEEEASHLCVRATPTTAFVLGTPTTASRPGTSTTLT